MSTVFQYRYILLCLLLAVFHASADSLTLSYDGNRLTGVTEAAADYDVTGSFEYKRARGSQYIYDCNGSLVADKSRGIVYITYDGNGNPGAIYSVNGNVTRYVYSASGQKLRAVYYTAMPYITRTFGVQPPKLEQWQTQYADSTDYLLGGSLVMKNGRIDKRYFDGGYARAMSTGSTTDRFVFYYYNKDHLGNNREVVDIKTRFHQVTSYYPFGAPYADPAAVSGAEHQPYKYNGKELDLMHGLNTYDYGARQYDPILGRFTQIDPMCEKYYNFHPYAYCMNNPMNAIDLEGKYTEVINKGNKTFQVVGGVPNNDLNVYIVDNDYLRRTGEIIGKTISAYSFMDDYGRPIVGATIDLDDTSGQSFWNKFVSNTPNIVTYMLNATEYRNYDFKNNGILSRANQYDTELYHYRGMNIAVNGVNYISSARDIGNMTAGYIAAKKGLSWDAARKGFDFLESLQRHWPSTEGLPTQNAQKFGFNAYSIYWERLTNWFNTHNSFF